MHVLCVCVCSWFYSIIFQMHVQHLIYKILHHHIQYLVKTHVQLEVNEKETCPYIRNYISI